jgi:ribonuclease P protein component
MNRRFRLKSSADFKRVRQFGKSYVNSLLVLITLNNKLDQTRIGIAAGRTVGSAVQRNRVKRIMRAAFQPYLENLPIGWDLILIARRKMMTADLDATQKSLVRLLRRAELL